MVLSYGFERYLGFAGESDSKPEPDSMCCEAPLEQEPAMATRTFGDVRNRTAPPRSVLRPAMAAMIAAREVRSHRRVNAHLLGLDDATLAALGYDRKILEDAGRGLGPL